MTKFGNDSSHYDGILTQRDGLDLYVHKITDGNHFFLDPEYRNAMDAASFLQIPTLGAYHVLWNTNWISQMDWFYQQVNTLTPWWKDLGYFKWQLDCEPFSYNGGAPGKNSIQGAGNYLISKYGIHHDNIYAYAPKWHYGDSLTGLTFRLWSSNYGSNPTGHYRDIYPGDNSSRWSGYSGQARPIILQYGSNAIIAGQTTCDANAFTEDLGGTVALTQAEIESIAKTIIFNTPLSNGATVNNALATLMLRAPTNLNAQLASILTAASNNPTVDATITPEAAAAIAAQISAAISIPTAQDVAKAVTDEESKRLAD